nr:unnamed protein product [Haemonchus contortus]
MSNSHSNPLSDSTTPVQSIDPKENNNGEKSSAIKNPSVPAVGREPPKKKACAGDRNGLQSPDLRLIGITKYAINERGYLVKKTRKPNNRASARAKRRLFT